MNLSQRLRQLAASTGLDGFAHELRAIADEMEAQPADVTDSMIREAFLANGFTIKDGYSDLKPYVYAAARAILALRPERVPMTDEQVDSLRIDGRLHWLGKRQIIRAVEAHHGIKPKEQA